MTQSNVNNSSIGVIIEEPTLFEISHPGAMGIGIPKWDVPKVDSSKHFGKLNRKSATQLPELSEPEVMRHFTRLSNFNYSMDAGIYPLGSCTMKHNPRLNEEIARSAEICALHPYDPEEWSQAQLSIMYELTEDLKEITGLPGVTLQPCAGAHGEFAGLLMIAAYHRAKGRTRKTILAPDTSHGTNPASASFAGFKTVQIKTGADGVLHPDAVAAVLNDDVAGLMITNPNTLGIFEKHIKEIAKLLHEKDALLYIDGANMNAIMGVSRPGEFGADVIHINLHKTFSTPHGGGGPGSGPVAVSDKLLPFLPVPKVLKHKDTYSLSYDGPQTIGRVKAFYGNFLVLVRAWCYIRALGGEGLRKVSENACLNANYIRSKLVSTMNLPVDAPTLHEVVFNDKLQKDAGGPDTTKIAKKLIDFGMHPPTMHFPLLVSGAFMIEPTETEYKRELDRFIDAVKIAVQGDGHEAAPVHVFREKIDEAKAARELVLKYKPK